jgi:hypothetical protein
MPAWKILAWGHPNITAKHATTFMITRDAAVGPRGDCIIGVRAECGAADLPGGLKELIRSGKRFLIRIVVSGLEEEILARGHPDLPLTHPSDLVVRKSRFICDRTVAIEATKAAGDLSRDIVRELADPKTTVALVFQTLP